MVQVRDLMKLPALKGVELVAGAGGDSRKVEHVTVMEVPDIKQWLKGNDLLITSFYSVRKSEEAQCRLIRELSDTCCCVAVKTGKYVDCISERVKRTADECGLPVFEIPFHIAYIDIIVSVMNLIFEDRGNSEILLHCRLLSLLYQTLRKTSRYQPSLPSVTNVTSTALRK